MLNVFAQTLRLHLVSWSVHGDKTNEPTCFGSQELGRGVDGIGKLCRVLDELVAPKRANTARSTRKMLEQSNAYR